VGKPVPEFVAGDECLFCHRNDVGPSWNDNHHNRSVREIEADSDALAALREAPELKGLGAQVSLVVGEKRRQRFLKPAEGFGKLDLLSVQWVPPRGDQPGALVHEDQTRWLPERFGDACAGCHSTGVDSGQRTFATRSLDCCVCHGEVPNEHSKNPALVHLSPHRNDPARVVTSACAQCHVRSGRSRSTGLPYPNNFVAGDNLFRDFEVDFSDAALAMLNPADAHVVANVRDVVVRGSAEVTCLTCHDVHKQTARRHHQVAESALCLLCHNEEGSKKVRKAFEVHSQTCGY
jgi:predicted CXXCH cytochrome family protein